MDNESFRNLVILKVQVGDDNFYINQAEKFELFLFFIATEASGKTSTK